MVTKREKRFRSLRRDSSLREAYNLAYESGEIAVAEADNEKAAHQLLLNYLYPYRQALAHEAAHSDDPAVAYELERANEVSWTVNPPEGTVGWQVIGYRRGRVPKGARWLFTPPEPQLWEDPKEETEW